MYPNTVLYKQGENMLYYINQAGGYESRAKKSRAYVVYYEWYGIATKKEKFKND